MPNTSEGFDQVEASASPEHAVNVVKFESVQSDPAPRRRRGGRRVVRGVGAAGASLELKVEEHAATPLFEEPKLPVAQPAHDAGDVAVSSDDGDSDGVSRPSRRRRRSAQFDDDVREIADEQSTRTRRRRRGRQGPTTAGRAHGRGPALPGGPSRGLRPRARTRHGREMDKHAARRLGEPQPRTSTCGVNLKVDLRRIETESSDASALAPKYDRHPGHLPPNP